MEPAVKYWEGVQDVNDVEIIEIPEGESGLEAQREILTAERLDRIAQFLATPTAIRERWDGPKDARELAAQVGFRVKNFAKWKYDPRMVKRAAQYLQAACVYAMADVVYGQMLLATPEIEQLEDGTFRITPGDKQAANFIATIGKFMRSGGPGGGTTIHNTQVSTADSGTGPGRLSDQELERRIDERVRRVQASDGEHEGPEAP